MNKVLIFTNVASWRGISDEIRDRVDWAFFPNESHPVLECAPGISLVYDSIDDAGLKQLFEDSPNDRMFILIHTRGRQRADFEPWIKRCIILSGKHENNIEDRYYPAFDIITDPESNKLERIIYTFFVEEAALALLHECMTPGRDLDRSLVYETLYQKEYLRKDLDAFKKKYESSKSPGEYTEELEHLRDRILG